MTECTCMYIIFYFKMFTLFDALLHVKIKEDCKLPYMPVLSDKRVLVLTYCCILFTVKVLMHCISTHFNAKFSLQCI